MRRRMFLLAGAVVLLAAGLAAATLRPAPPPPGPQPAFPALIANSRKADRIEVVHGPDILWLERRGQVWGLARAAGYPVRPESVESLMDGLLALTLEHPVAGTPASAGLEDPSAPEGAGTLIRVLTASDDVLAAVIVGNDAGLVRRPGQPTLWLATPVLRASPDPADWIGRHVPPPDAAVAIVNGDDQATAKLRQTLAALEFTEVRASPQVHPAPLRSIPLRLADGTALLSLGRLDGQEWLQISGDAAWARRLAPYAFAVPAGSLSP